MGCPSQAAARPSRDMLRARLRCSMRAVAVFSWGTGAREASAAHVVGTEPGRAVKGCEAQISGALGAGLRPCASLPTWGHSARFIRPDHCPGNGASRNRGIGTRRAARRSQRCSTCRGASSLVGAPCAPPGGVPIPLFLLAPLPEPPGGSCRPEPRQGSRFVPDALWLPSKQWATVAKQAVGGGKGTF
jgi:hypothetical protein